MKSLVCNLDGRDTTAAALKEAEYFANPCGLSEKSTLHLRLLAEELPDMATGILELLGGTFRIERASPKDSPGA